MALAANAARLAQWLPARVATPAPPEQLRERLAGYAADFAAGRAFRYAVFGNTDPGDEDPQHGILLGGADLHPRSQAGRVPLGDANRIELGYWLAESAEGSGYALEATRALLGVAASLPGLSHVEARVDPRNVRSAAVARRLGLEYARTEAGLDVWERLLADLRVAAHDA